MQKGKIIKVGFFILLFSLLSCNSKVKEVNSSNISEENRKVVNVNSNGDNQTVLSHPDTIVIKNMQFNPYDLHVKKGTNVVWLNNDIVIHDATKYPDKSWTSGPLSPGESWSMKVDESFDYFCSIHITMKGKVTVDP